MSNTLSYIIQINSNFDKVNANFNKFSNNVLTKIEKIQAQFNAVKLNAFIQNVNAAADGLNSLNAPGLSLNSNMKELQAITGVTGSKLQEIEGYARESAKTFGGSASQGVESYKVILSKLSPEIAKVPKALQAMGREVNLTSKLMGGDTVGATELLTTAMNQYEVSLQDPLAAAKEMARMNNIMAKSAQEGSAEFPAIKEGLEASGLTAKKANISFEETNAWLQLLDKSGKKGAEGGVAFRNVIATLNQGRFLPKDVRTELQNAGIDVNDLTDQTKSFADRLKPLQGIMNDSALLTKIFGKENQAAAIAMLSNVDEAERLTKAVGGTNSVMEQASVIMESQEEKNKKMKAQIDDLKISLFNGTNGWIGYASVAGEVARDFSDLMPIFAGAGKVLATVTSATKMQALWTSIVSGATTVWTGVQSVFNAVMGLNPVVLITMAIIALIGVISWVAAKTEGWGKAWKHTVTGAKFIFLAYVSSVKASFNLMVNGFMIGINKIQIAWYKFKNTIGLGDKNANNAEINKLNSQVEARKQSIKAGYKQAVEYGIKAGQQFKSAFDAVKWKKEGNASEDAKISEAGIPGVPAGSQGGGQGSGEGEGMKKSNEAVATGGTKHNYITIKINELVGLRADSVSGGKETAKQAGEGIADELLRVLAMAASSTG